MIQFCPKCQRWYDISSNICPKCNVTMYDEEEYNNIIEDDEPQETASLSSIKLMNNLGWILIMVGIIGILIIPMLISKLDKEIIEILIPFVCFVSFAVGVALLIISRYLYRNKKLEETHGNPYVQCPYCKSRKVIKLTTIDRAGSFFVVGLASGKIGKQWHCNNCDSDF